jgi:hypothetical protein
LRAHRARALNHIHCLKLYDYKKKIAVGRKNNTTIKLLHYYTKKNRREKSRNENVGAGQEIWNKMKILNF